MSQATGNAKVLEFSGPFVTIRRKSGLRGLVAGGGEVRLPLKSIAFLEWSPPSGINPGFIRLNTGAYARLQGNVLRPAFMDAVNDQYSVVFARSQLSAFSQLRDEIDLAIAG
jgi:Domain of unknown function (DUF4429)